MSSTRDVGGVYVLVLGRPEDVAEAVERDMVCINLDEDVWSSVFNYIFRIKKMGFLDLSRKHSIARKIVWKIFLQKFDNILGSIVVMKKKIKFVEIFFSYYLEI